MAPLGRILRHWVTTPWALRHAFPPPVLARIQDAIAAAEAQTTGEIVFAVEAALPWSYLRRNAPARQRSVMVFSKLHVWDTEHNNGVLIHVDLAERDVEVVADRGIARHVPPEAWQAVCDEMRVAYRAGRFEAGSVAGVSAVGLHLAAHFPRDAAFELDELPDRPSVI